MDDLSADNKKEFGYPFQTIDVLQFFKWVTTYIVINYNVIKFYLSTLTSFFIHRDGIIGAKIYLLNESMNLEASKRHYKRWDKFFI